VLEVPISPCASPQTHCRESKEVRVRVSFFFISRGVSPHPVLDVVVDDEVQLLVRKPVVRRQHSVDFVENGLGQGSQNFSLERAPDACIFALDH